MTPLHWALYSAYGILAIIITVPAAIGALAAIGLLAVRVLSRRNRDREVGDNFEAIFCPHCDGRPQARCTCKGDCGRRDCEWPVWQALTDSEAIRRNLAALVAAAERGDRG